MIPPVRWFKKDNGKLVPVSNERYLFPALSPTSPGTNYWDSPPPAPISDRQTGRILLQVHQMLGLLSSMKFEFRGKSILDIGTGNGMVPRLLLELSELDRAVGADPFLDGEHKTSWQPHDHEEGISRLREFIDRVCEGRLDFASYGRHTQQENIVFHPPPMELPERTTKEYRFSQVGMHDLEQIGEKFDLLYCKAIEHIPDWRRAFASAAMVAKPDAIFYLKHRSFFSYLGAHRYASIGVPWGHVLLTDAEFRRYAIEFHPERADEMCEFFFSGLSYPRCSVTNMLTIAQESGFLVQGIQYEAPRYGNRVFPFTEDVDGFWDIVWENYPRLSAEEVFSGIVHLVLKKV